MDGNGADHEAEYLHDLVQRSEPDEAVAEPRHRWPWVILWVVYALLLTTAVYGSFNGKYDEESKALQWDALLKQELKMKGLRSQMGQGQSDTSSAIIRALGSDVTPEDLQAAAAKDRTAALYHTVLRFERGQKPVPRELEMLSASPHAQGRAAARIYQAQKLTPQQARDLTSQLAKDRFVSQVVRAHAYQKAGDESLHSRLSKAGNVYLLLAISVFGCGALMIGVLLWIVFLSLRSSDYLRPLGHPVSPITPGQADLLVLRADQLLAGYLALGLFLRLLVPKSSMALQGYTTVFLMVGMVLLIFRYSVLGWKLDLNTIGVNAKGFGKNVLWGIGGYLAVTPLIVVTAVLSLALSKGLPKPYHPIGGVLMNTQDPWLLFALFLQAAVMAPLWEEVMFRGCLFPAVSRVTKSTVVGAVATSFMFGSIHPQGIAGWLPLITIALVNCGLAHQTKSLVPCIVLHAMNNGLILAIVLLTR